MNALIGQDFPPMPDVARKILAVDLDDEQGAQQLYELVEQDPLLLARIVGLANAPFFGASRKVVSLRDAVAIVGWRRVKAVALSAAVMRSMAGKSEVAPQLNRIWLHSLSVAMGMDTLARYMLEGEAPQDDELYLTGLLHDIGFLVLDRMDPALSARYHRYLETQPGDAPEAVEAAMLDQDHAELGALLAEHWGLPESTVAVLRYHHTPYLQDASPGWPMAVMVGLAEKLLPTI